MVNRRELLKYGLATTVAATVAPKTVLAATSRRVLSLYNANSFESLTKEYWVDGWYNPDALSEFNYLMRDRRSDEVTNMDVGLLDILHMLQQRIGGPDKPIHIVCGYRSPTTNAALAASRRGVARNSYHVTGQAADIRVPGYSLYNLRQHAASLELGGVGYYRHSDFVHVDTGPVRTWG